MPAPRRCQPFRLFQHRGDVRRPGAHADHRGHAAATDQSVRSHQARHRARVGRLRPRLSLGLCSTAVLQRLGSAGRRFDRRGSRSRNAPDPARDFRRNGPPAAHRGVRHRLSDAGRHLRARLHSRRRPGRSASARAGKAAAGAGHALQPRHRPRLQRARGDPGRRRCDGQESAGQGRPAPPWRSAGAGGIIGDDSRRAGLEAAVHRAAAHRRNRVELAQQAPRGYRDR